jgi:regulator of protease activity HflC (stomatin/prohibitin superfamily)
MILEAQGERRSAVEEAEGEKQSNIIRAQGEKQSQILEAQGDAISTVLRAKSAESMGERAIIDKGMETLEKIGQGDSATFILPQELTSLVGRYGKQLSGSDVQEQAGLDSLDFDEETREMLGLDDIEEIIGQIDQAAEMDVQQMEQEAQAVKSGEGMGDIKPADEVISEADSMDDIEDADAVIEQMESEMDEEPNAEAEPATETDGGDDSTTKSDDTEEMEFDKELE